MLLLARGGERGGSLLLARGTRAAAAGWGKRGSNTEEKGVGSARERERKKEKGKEGK